MRDLYIDSRRVDLASYIANNGTSTGSAGVQRFGSQAGPQGTVHFPSLQAKGAGLVAQGRASAVYRVVLQLVMIIVAWVAAVPPLTPSLPWMYLL